MTSDTGTQGEGSGSAALLRRTPDPALLAQAYYNVAQRRFADSPTAPDLPDWRDPSIKASVWDKSVADAAEVVAEYDRLADSE